MDLLVVEGKVMDLLMVEVSVKNLLVGGRQGDGYFSTVSGKEDTRLYLLTERAGKGFFLIGGNIEEGLIQKTRQRLWRRIGGQNPCRASRFALVFLKQMVELNHLIQKD